MRVNGRLANRGIETLFCFAGATAIPEASQFSLI
jgi:hypothetical protein